MWLSSALLPITNDVDYFWAAKAVQIFTLNPHFDDISRLIGNAVIPILIWYFVHVMLGRKRQTP
jgi:hypothetical protein